MGLVNPSAIANCESVTKIFDHLYTKSVKQRLTVPLVLSQLQKMYSPPRSFLEWSTPLDLTIATLLSAQCTDEVVNRVTKKLFSVARSPQDYLELSRGELENLIHSCGTYKNKAKYIHALCQKIIDDYDGKVPQTMKGLTSLPGVGRKTASIVLYAAFGKLEGIAVDTHVHRLAVRLGLTKKKTQDAIELDLMKKTPKKDWGVVNTLLISHGRSICTARNPKCEKCVFSHTCPSSLVAKVPKV